MVRTKPTSPGRRLILPLLAGLLAVAPLAAASAPREGPPVNPHRVDGQVFLRDGAKGEWATPEAARARGFFEYHRRWFPKRMRRVLERWEKEDEKHVEWADARRLTSRHYRLVTNVPRFIVETELQPFLDELYRTYTRVFKEKFGLRSKAANKKFIHIHRGFEDYATNNAFGGRPRSRSNPGFIMGGSVLVVYYDETEPEMFYSTVFHEGAHQFVHAMLPGAEFPKWIDEALATYFEGCSYSRTDRRITVNYLPPNRLKLAQHLLREKGPGGTPAWDLASVLTAPDRTFNARHYALAWSFAYFMTHADEGERRKRFVKFLKEMNGAGVKHTPQEIFARIVRVDPLELAQDWRRFVLGLRTDVELRSPILTRVKRNIAGVDLRRGDIIRTFNYHSVTGSKHFNELWKSRPRDRESRLVVVRREKVPGPMTYRARLLELTVPPDDSVDVISTASWPRDPNLTD
jgi:hypothetical protein